MSKSPTIIEEFGIVSILLAVGLLILTLNTIVRDYITKEWPIAYVEMIPTPGSTDYVTISVSYFASDYTKEYIEEMVYGVVEANRGVSEEVLKAELTLALDGTTIIVNDPNNIRFQSGAL